MTAPASELVAYSALVPALPLDDAAKIYLERFGVAVRVERGRPEKWLPELREGTAADLVCCGAEFLLDRADADGVTRSETRRSPGRRRAALAVPRGNPGEVATVEDLARPSIRIGISVEGCTLGLWDEVTARTSFGASVRSNIVERAKGCGALLGLLSHRRVDVALGWWNFDRVPGFEVEVVPLPEPFDIHRAAGIAVAARSSNPDAAARSCRGSSVGQAKDVIVVGAGSSHDEPLALGEVVLAFVVASALFLIAFAFAQVGLGGGLLYFPLLGFAYPSGRPPESSR